MLSVRINPELNMTRPHDDARVELAYDCLDLVTIIPGRRGPVWSVTGVLGMAHVFTGYDGENCIVLNMMGMQDGSWNIVVTVSVVDSPICVYTREGRGGDVLADMTHWAGKIADAMNYSPR